MVRLLKPPPPFLMIISLLYFMVIAPTLVSHTHTHTTIDRKSHLYTVYSFGAGEAGSLEFFFPKFPFHRTESFKTTIADMAGSLVGWTLAFKSESICEESDQGSDQGLDQMSCVRNTEQQLRGDSPSLRPTAVMEWDVSVARVQGSEDTSPPLILCLQPPLWKM